MTGASLVLSLLLSMTPLQKKEYMPVFITEIERFGSVGRMMDYCSEHMGLARGRLERIHAGALHRIRLMQLPAPTVSLAYDRGAHRIDTVFGAPEEAAHLLCLGAEQEITSYERWLTDTGSMPQ